MEGRVAIWTGGLFALGIFPAMVYINWGGLNSAMLVAVLALVCAISGAFLGLIVYVVLKIWPGICGERTPGGWAALTGGMRVLVFVPAVLNGVVLLSLFWVGTEYLWAVLAASAGSVLVLSPRGAARWSVISVLLRSVASTLIGAIAALAAGVTLLSFDFTERFMVVCFAYALAWSVVHAIGLHVQWRVRSQPNSLKPFA